jgi:hypothetical protein
LKYIFVSSWDIFQTAQALRQNELKLQRAVQACLEGDATAQAAAVVNHEPSPANMKMLKLLIHTMVGNNSKTIWRLEAMEQRQLCGQQPKNEPASAPLAHLQTEIRQEATATALTVKVK